MKNEENFYNKYSLIATVKVHRRGIPLWVPKCLIPHISGQPQGIAPTENDDDGKKEPLLKFHRNLGEFPFVRNCAPKDAQENFGGNLGVILRNFRNGIPTSINKNAILVVKRYGC